MTGSDCNDCLWKIRFTAGFNRRYHQRLEQRWGWIEKGVRIAVGVLAIFGLMFAIKDVPPWGLITASVSLVAALALNVWLFRDWEKEHREMFQHWSALLSEVERERLRCCDLAANEEVSSPTAARVAALVKEEHRLHQMEKAPWRRLLRRCEEDENEATWGEGIRTNKQVAEERQRRLTSG